MRKTQGLKREITTQIKGISMLALAVFCYAGLQQTEQTGWLGGFVYRILRTLAGETAIVIPFLIGILALRIMLPEKILSLKSRLAGLLILLLLVTVSAHLMLMQSELENLAGVDFYRASLELGTQYRGGGVIGAALSAVLFFCFRDIGSYIVIGALGLVALLLITNVSINEIFDYLKKFGALLVRFFKRIGRFFRETYEILTTGSDDVGEPARGKREKKRGRNKGAGDEDEEQGADAGGSADNRPLEISFHQDLTAAPKDSIYQQERKLELVEPPPEEADSGYDKIKLPPRGQYTMPPLDLLTKANRLGEQQQLKGIRDRARLLENTLSSFGVKARVVHVQTGPTVTRFEVQPEAGVKVSKIVSLADDLALNLAAPLVRIEAPIPGKAALGIEVPNKIVSVVYLREVLEDEEFQQSASPLVVGLGKDITGVPIITDLTRMPHLLIAGSTGSGKSVCLNAIIVSILYKSTPEQVRFLMIDPKVVELSVYNDIPHLLYPVVTDPKRASLALRNMVKEMHRRYELFAQHEVRDIAAYNELAAESLEGEKLPYIVVIIDELADLMLVAPGEVEDSIARLAQMSRAAGIHLVIATQRPSVDVLTGIIKANITSRIAFTVSSQVDSRTILDMAGAEKLLGRGDMLFYPVGAVKPFRVQGAYVSEREVKRITDYIRKQGKAQYSDLASMESEEELGDEMDELFPEAMELVVRTGQASISLLQRRFRIGYTRAARLIDDLERRGVVGPFEGSKPREVIITPEQAQKLYEEYKQKIDS
ncbi:MAG: DNA translocase FtsK [Dethiobacteria bacterium]|jgi:S-DNA-T family DNA segregation ATPase FtsK/SpoIIIE|nr:DNA translocase FtsK [Bacillota bacterium]HOP68472.1 DNA translocase FtsK [Bacillota bacterium]HPT33577.1 DNA translocase FtsK [Bacillota bacterium]HPZ64078.1 DNA translocase FtsK [Bacillota bacterium]HQD06372.1 DNA translocase FtsK [Bacillota bacterium]